MSRSSPTALDCNGTELRPGDLVAIPVGEDAIFPVVRGIISEGVIVIDHGERVASQFVKFLDFDVATTGRGVFCD